jgi:hypothetical protein
MGFGKNFAQTVFNDGVVLTVSGKSGTDPDGQLISRYVALEQHGKSVGAPATLDGGDWDCTIPVVDYGFETGPVSAIGAEVYYYGGPAHSGQTPQFALFTWSQALTIETPLGGLGGRLGPVHPAAEDPAPPNG